MNIGSFSPDIQQLIIQTEKSLGINPQVTLECCNLLEEKGKILKSESLMGYALFHKAQTHYIMNDMRSFYEENILAMHHLEKAEDWETLVMSNNLLGIMSLNRGNALVAMDSYMAALDICNKHHLVDIKWMVQVNIGTIYLSVEMFPNAIEYFNYGKDYILAHQDIPGYYDYLTSIYIGLGRCYVNRNEIHQLVDIMAELENVVEPHVDDINKLMIAGFKAYSYNARGLRQQRDVALEYVNANLTRDIPVLDHFDELYSYLCLLYEVGEPKAFEKAANLIESLTEKTTMMYLKQKVIALKIKFYRDQNREEEKKRAAVEYFELGEKLENESRLMHTNMLEFRNRFAVLDNKNKEITKENEELVKKSTTDALTGIANRFGLTAYQDEVIGECIGGEKSLAIEILDIDYFKQYNDNYGHQAGDNAIKTVADSLGELSRGRDIFCARYGGDEFVLVYVGYTFEEIKALSNELREIILSKKVEHKYSLCIPWLTISQGICWGRPKRGSKIWDYMHEADKMLYKVKERARNDMEFTVIEG